MAEIIPAFTGKVEKGILKPDSPIREKEWLKNFEGKKVKYSYRIWRDTRSNNQNSYYWAVVVKILGDYFGYDPVEMHEALKEKFLSEPRDKYGLIKIKSSAGLDTLQFEEYLEWIRRWAVKEWQVYIPLPNETDFGGD